MVTLTDRAATKFKELAAQEPAGEAEVLRDRDPGRGLLRVPVRARLRPRAAGRRQRARVHGIRSSSTRTARRISQGAEIDFVDALRERGFAIENPNVVAACGCGSSFQATDEVDGEPVAAHAGGGCGRGCSH